MNEIFDDTNFDMYRRTYFNVEDFMRRVGIEEEELQLAAALPNCTLYDVFNTAVLDDFQALSDLLFKEYSFRIPEVVLMGLNAGTVLDLLYRTDKNTSMFEKNGVFKEMVEDELGLMKLRNLPALNRTLFDDERYTELSIPASTRCRDVYDTDLLSKALSDKFDIQIMPKVLEYLSVIDLLDIVYRTDVNTRYFLDSRKKCIMRLQKMFNKTWVV